MMPSIEQYNDPCSDCLILKLKVPRAYIIENKNYKLKLFWWMLKFSFKALS